MYMQTVDVARQDSATMTGATKTYELETAGELSYIDLLVAFQVDGSGVDIVKNIPDWLTAIEVVGNSTDILLSLDARELAALVFYMNGKVPTERRTEVKDAWNYFHIPIPFGRKLGDPLYGLKLENWDLVELNITNGDSDTGNFFDVGNYTVREKFIRDGPGFTGRLKAYEANSWTPPSATSEKTVAFPTEYMIRQALISVLPTYPARTAAFSYEMWEVLHEINLSYKSGGIVVFNEDTEELMRQNEDEFGLVELGGVVQADNDDYFSTDLGFVMDANATIAAKGLSDSSFAFVGLTNYPESRLGIHEQFLSAGHAALWHARGYAYMLSCIFNWDKDNSMANLLDPKAMETVRLKYTSEQTAGKVRTVLQQVVPY